MVVQKQRKPGDQAFWPKVVLKKWLNLRSKNSEFSADAEEEEEDDDGSDADERESCGCDGGAQERRQADGGAEIAASGDNLEGAPYRLRRRNSETLRAQYINTKELRICVGTYNAAGLPPPDGLDIAGWLAGGGGEPADIYVLGFQEVVPLNAGNVFGAEDGRPAAAWEDLIRDTLTRAQPAKPRYRCYSHPASPSRLDPPAGSDELLPGADTETDADDDGTASSFPAQPEQHAAAGDTPRRLSRLDQVGAVRDDLDADDQDEPPPPAAALLKTLSKTDRIGLAWPEQPLDIAPSPSFRASRSFAAYRSFRGSRPHDDGELAMVPDLDLDLGGSASRKRRPPFVRIVSKQMVGIFLTIWVRRGLRKCVRNLKVSTVGVGAMGYIGNKGAVSVSISIYQTMFCFVCTHLAAGERPSDLHKRNADVQEIHRRTHFACPGNPELPRGIYDHERIFWLGDLNYRIDVAYEKAHDLISSMDWSQLAERDQLKRELKKGRAFDGWTEGVLEFAPTYKYELSSEKYIGDDQRGGRRTPAWCDRVLSFGRGVRLLRYGRAEMTLSDHRPVAAAYAAEVEVFSSRKLQRALTLTDAEVEGGQVVVPDLGF